MVYTGRGRMNHDQGDLTKKEVEMEARFVYRVYSSYHDDKGAETFEYGTYSSLEKAQARLRTVLSKKGGEWKWSETGHSAHREGAWPGEEDSHYIDKIGLDCDMEESNTIFT